MSEKILDKKPLLDGDLVLFPVAVTKYSAKTNSREKDFSYLKVQSIVCHGEEFKVAGVWSDHRTKF